MTTKVKICGINSEVALDAAIEAGADYVGFVFYPKSPRNIDIATAAKFVRRARERSRTKTVALVVDPEDQQLDEIVKRFAPDFFQLHGHESLERVRAVRSRTGVAIIKAIPVRTRADVSAAGTYHTPGSAADTVLFDAKPPADPKALPGGNGLSFDWRILDAVEGRYPYALAGGLTPENVGEAIRLTGAAIVDVSSGVESAPGRKDPELIRRFLKAAKTAKQTA